MWSECDAYRFVETNIFIDSMQTMLDVHSHLAPCNDGDGNAVANDTSEWKSQLIMTK